ncbi:ABC transporter ATP-binding protein [Mesorhizobium sp.]|uniref:ABC transporter ATP-binding protein n=1 Tax=Mesorhizobium sp. TaxID=1871066 RepID=UPI000FE43933|nr:ABC transporter ATP-binding protein [Mesorhizobium sp.]RWA67817.1 MAG: ABC transporter ATP-binding protein [Mesorhizobium sp.]RWB97060.1 MAG: ABC transporter ATP-binding protein [Mesorhizobium sp.]RWG85209.1 MAG: ABC transporter ATP-binding protein [Mesorhizobium sp.]RWG88992.1 MAG: ABC transporter ATP-binding protein [Mesorhizobium sp.]RWK06822.1 MAG: ABC transporter ATP-binding protein [Mesorhizobium sp.]
MTNLVEVRNLKIEATTDAGRVVDIIRGVSLDIADGEIVALIGESGSGKTTVALSLMGYARPGCRITGGEINVNGKDMAALSEKERARLRGTDIAYVPQSAAASFNPSSTIMEQVIEVTRIHKLMPPEQARRRAVELFRALSLPDPDGIGARYPHQVSGGQLQRLAAAMALIGDPKLVIFDEPTTALDVTTQIDVLKAFKSVMRASGIAGVYVSHDLAVVAQIADRIVVLKGGEVQETGTTGEILSTAQHPYTRELLAAFEPKRRQALADADAGKKELLRIDNLTAGYGPVRDDGLPLVRAVDSVSLVVEKGRNLGVIGESGCGKSTLARVIAGIHPAAAGEIVFDGKELERAARKRSQDQLREMQIVFQYADTALNPAKPVEDIISRPLAFYHGLDRQARSKRVDELLDMVRLPRALRYRHPSELSGGQKQRVNFARALAADPKLIICDEITSALDTVVASAVIELLKELQRELGLSYIFISHDLSVVEAICDQIMVMYNGERVEQIAPDKVKTPAHPYSKLLFSSVPKLDPTWLDGLVRDPALVSQYGHR